MQTDCRQTDRLTTQINISVSCYNKCFLQKQFYNEYFLQNTPQKNFPQKHPYTTISERDAKKLELLSQNQLYHPTMQTKFYYSCSVTTAELILRSEKPNYV